MIDFLRELSFANPLWLFGLVLVPLLWILQKNKGSRSSLTFSSLAILGSLGFEPKSKAGRFALTLISLAIAASFFALARPQHLETYTDREASGIDIVIALDLSTSMTARDFRPPNSRRPIQRIDAAKAVIQQFVRQRPNDRMGLVVFAGQPYPVCPLTLDHDWLLSSIDRVQIEDITEDGTAIGSAIAGSATRLDARDSKSKIIVLVTDGASNSGKLSPQQAASLAKELEIKIYSIAIGTEDGRISRNVMAAPRQEFDPETLQEIATTTGGEYFWAKNYSSLEETFSTINELEKSEARASSTIQKTEFYPWLCGLAGLLTLFALIGQVIILPPQP